MAENIILGLLERFWSFAFPPRTKLYFERKDFVHWYNEDDFRSGITAEMFIINRGKKTTTIREVDIIKMVPDHLEYKFFNRTKNFELLPGKDVPYRFTFFFRGDYLRYDEIEIDVEFTHTEGVEKVHAVSKLLEKLKKIRDEDERSGTLVFEDLPDDKVANFILQSEQNYPKLKYEARFAKSGKLNHKDIWSYLRSGEKP